MKMKMRPRYYCEHCGKGSGSPSAMRRHEPSCTANPHRECRMCREDRDLTHLISLLRDPGSNWRVRMANLRAAVDGCPCCILAAIRQSGVQKGMNDPNEEGYPDNSEMMWREQGAASSEAFCLGFDFKTEKKGFLRERAADRYYDV